MKDFEIEPYTEFQVPGTNLVVHHQGDEEQYAYTHTNGDVELRGTHAWFLRGLADPTHGMTQIAERILAGDFDMAVRARAAWLARTEDWSPDDEHHQDLTQYEAGR